MAGRPRTRANRKAGITCGAKNRRGLPCQCKLTFKGGKCKFHGGLSTGPKTEEGRRRVAQNIIAWNERRRISKLAALALAGSRLAESPINEESSQ